MHWLISGIHVYGLFISISFTVWYNLILIEKFTVNSSEYTWNIHECYVSTWHPTKVQSHLLSTCPFIHHLTTITTNNNNNNNNNKYGLLLPQSPPPSPPPPLLLLLLLLRMLQLLLPTVLLLPSPYTRYSVVRYQSSACAIIGIVFRSLSLLRWSQMISE